MLALKGTYYNGLITLEKSIETEHPVQIIVTFLDEFETSERKSFRLKDFSFKKSREILKKYKTSFCDTLIEERRSEQ